MSGDPFLALLKTFDAPELSQEATPIDFGSADMPYLATMRKVCRRTKTGIGLAAPQIGVMKRAIFVWPNRVGNGRLMLNPEIVWRSNIYIEMNEGCLSYPGVEIRYQRPETIRAIWFDENWKSHEEILRGWECRIVLHEIDHLNGICRVGEEWRKRNGLMPPCQFCGCTDDDCRDCIDATGMPCYWVKPGLCSRCAGEQAARKETGGVS